MFGVGRREGHDSTAFYERFHTPEVSTDDQVAPPKCVDRLIVGDARHMGDVADNSVALVVTSPPYFAGKEYEEALGHGHVPATYVEYLEQLREVFVECVRVLEPGGRIAINVANLGRRPYRSLSADVTTILQDDLRLLLRGEVLWIKQRGAAGNCAWGSFQRPGNPVIRDLSERVIIASKGRFDRAISAKDRAKIGLPSMSSMTRDEFMEATVDVWEIPPERASRVGHPAPFPVALPERLIHMNTYVGDLVLDPLSAPAPLQSRPCAPAGRTSVTTPNPNTSRWPVAASPKKACSSTLDRLLGCWRTMVARPNRCAVGGRRRRSPSGCSPRPPSRTSTTRRWSCPAWRQRFEHTIATEGRGGSMSSVVELESPGRGSSRPVVARNLERRRDSPDRSGRRLRHIDGRPTGSVVGWSRWPP